MTMKTDNLTNNVLINADNLIGMRDLLDKSISAIVTDPLYLYLKNQKLDIPFDEDATFSEFDRLLKDDGFIVIFGRGFALYRWNLKLEKLGFKFKEEIVWDKNTPTSAFGKIIRIHETATIVSKKGVLRKSHVPYLERRKLNLNALKLDVRRLVVALDKLDTMKEIDGFLQTGEVNYYDSTSKFIVTGKQQQASRQVSIVKSMADGFVETDIMRVPREHYSFKHPTQKPIKLMERLIKLVSDEGDVVLDPFAGSGSTLLAAKNLNRKYIGFEIDKEYFDVATERLEK